MDGCGVDSFVVRCVEPSQCFNEASAECFAAHCRRGIDDLTLPRVAYTCNRVFELAHVPGPSMLIQLQDYPRLDYCFGLQNSESAATSFSF